MARLPSFESQLDLLFHVRARWYGRSCDLTKYGVELDGDCLVNTLFVCLLLHRVLIIPMLDRWVS